MSMRDWALGRQRTYSADGLEELGFIGLIALGLLAVLISLGIWALL